MTLVGRSWTGRGGDAVVPDAVRADARGPVLTTRCNDTDGPAWFRRL